MIARCTDPKHKNYENYGGRGIKVCGAWATSFETFLADMGERPAGRTLDRKDVNGDYSAINCRWATTIEQHSNTRTTVLYSYEGVSKTLSEWERQLGMKKTLLNNRLAMGWSFEKAITTPVRVYAPKATK